MKAAVQDAEPQAPSTAEIAQEVVALLGKASGEGNRDKDAF